jgi:hypothetical protein
MERAVLEPEGRVDRSSADEAVNQVTVRYATEWADWQGDNGSAETDRQPTQDPQVPEAPAAPELEYWFG